MKVQTETSPEYIVKSSNTEQDAIIASAKRILESRLRTFGVAFTSPDLVKDFLLIKLSALESERFDVLFLNSQNKLIEHIPMFCGTIDGASVYPREIIKKALELNASALIIAHNHPSGSLVPSHADKDITKKIKDAAELMDIRLLDHLIVGGMDTYSFAENDLI